MVMAESIFYSAKDNWYEMLQMYEEEEEEKMMMMMMMMMMIWQTLGIGQKYWFKM
jgi:hypothetical protein